MKFCGPKVYGPGVYILKLCVFIHWLLSLSPSLQFLLAMHTCVRHAWSRSTLGKCLYLLAQVLYFLAQGAVGTRPNDGAHTPVTRAHPSYSLASIEFPLRSAHSSYNWSCHEYV